MIVIPDASAVGRFLLPDENRVEAGFALDICNKLALYVPPHWSIEVASLVVKAHRQGRIDADQVRQIVRNAAILAASVTIEAETTPAQLVSTAMALGLSAYDVSYLLLAQRLDVPLLAFDGRLRKAALAEGVEVLTP